MGTIEREPEVIDSLTSTSTIDALSANQGRILKNRQIQAVHTSQNTGGTAINAHGGASIAVSISPPSGYHLIAHVACWHSGDIGVIAGFDAYSTSPTYVGVYINNTTTANKTLSNFCYVHVLSLFEPD